MPVMLRMLDLSLHVLMPRMIARPAYSCYASYAKSISACAYTCYAKSVCICMFEIRSQLDMLVPVRFTMSVTLLMLDLSACVYA